MCITPTHPWRLDTNERYRDVVKTIMSLSTASLLLPVFFARNFLAIDAHTPLYSVFTRSIYCSWGMFALSIASGLFFQYLSAKWVRLAWNQPAGIFFSPNTKEDTVERCMEISFWITPIAFIVGLTLTIWFFVTFKVYS
ncbi:MAG: hypothetical protein ACFFCW_49620 [Candidatus Hodarchaeota archaeon]